MFAFEPFAEGAAREDDRGEPGSGDVAGAVADVDDEVAEVAEGAGVGELEPLLELDPAGAVVTDPPPVGEPGAPAVPDQPVEAVGIEHRVDVEVEAVADDDRQPVVPGGPVDQLEEAGPEPGRFEREDAERRIVGLHEVERGGVVLLDREFSRTVAGLELAPSGRSEALEELAGGIVEDDGVVEVEADKVRHENSFARPGAGARPMRLERAKYLASTAGQEALASLPGEWTAEDPVRVAARLRRRFPPEEAAALGEQLALRARMRQRFGEMPLQLATAEGLEMLTHPLVARRRAARLAALGLPVVDLTCGLGGDLCAVVETGTPAAGVEMDAATALLARVNTGGRVVIGDALRPPCDLARAAVVLDPGRRAGGARTFDPAGFSPPWDACLELLGGAAAGALKGPPGLDRAMVPGWCEYEAVQVGRDLRELTLWAGRGAAPGLRRAVLLPGGHEIDSEAPESDDVRPQVGRYVFDPESCVTRARLVRQLAAALGAWQLDERVAYLSADRAAAHPLCAAFEVLEVMPFGVKRLRELLRSRGWKPAEIRRRAFPLEPDELRRALGRVEGAEVTLICTTVGGERLVVVGRRLRPEGGKGG